MQLTVEFKNNGQRQFYYSTARNQTFSGGFNNGKSFIGCMKAISLLFTFPNYRMIIAREKYTDLKRTTMQTFFKMCPTELVASHNEQDGLTVFTNGSMVWWLHLDKVDENTLRGIEPNSVLVDQAEETQEKVYDVLDGRVGRWDGAIVPQELLSKFPEWPYKNGKPVAPSYIMLLCNPDTEFHYIYRKYHPESVERNSNYFFVEGEWDRELGSEETYDEAVKRDKEWVDKYVRGKWGTSSSAIHFIRPDSLLEPTPELINAVLAKGALSKVLDHGSTAPTACGWMAAFKGVYIFYREYYVANKVISYHRKAINELSGSEYYVANYADPHIFDKASQAKGGIYSVADEYMDSDLEGPPLYWLKADNNEFATRNRINELLAPSNKFKHPITGESPAPGLYFIKSTPEYPNGCREIIRQTGAQRKVLVGTVDGKNIYGEDRDEGITDHAYDLVRYSVAMHGSQPAKEVRRAPRMSMAYYQAVIRKQLSMRNAVVANN
jgi:hypothetical protein